MPGPAPPSFVRARDRRHAPVPGPRGAQPGRVSLRAAVVRLGPATPTTVSTAERFTRRRERVR